HAPPPPALSPLSLHDALPIYARERQLEPRARARSSDAEAHGRRRAVAGRELTRRVDDDAARAGVGGERVGVPPGRQVQPDVRARDRKSTRLNSSHVSISYAVF